MPEEIELKMSPLRQRLESQGQSVQIEIYGDGANGWLLEIVDEFGNSTVWDDSFPTDQEALDEAKNTIRDEGIGVLIGNPSGYQPQ
jgi:uncharacterized protein